MGGLMFGKDETIDCIVDVALKGANQEALCLAHKHTKVFVGAGVWLTDDGYVLGVTGDRGKYYDLPTGEELTQMQAASLLPSPLPPHSLSFWDYLFGYSLWLILGGFALFYGLRALLRARHEPPPLPAPAGTPAPGAVGEPPGSA